MDTKPLENFAKAARRELIAAVSAQASAVLAPGSVARTERAETVRRLESEIAVHSHEHVIDKVAYTWFNRLIALRFMDAKGYTGAGIVSPAHGQVHGQPEILADAKRGDIDTDVVTSSATRGAILGLLDGTRRSTDAEGEAYALLLTEYCRYWHKSMPFMFEREGDYTELLVPAGLLTDGGIVARARNVLTEEVCDDVEVIGWLYQFYISERKDEVFAGFKKNKKAGADEIPAATQLFTPHWIVRYLVENSVGRLWLTNHPESELVEQMDYYVKPVGRDADLLKIESPEELRVVDPAAGSGHMLTYAFDLLHAIYMEQGYAPSDIPNLIIEHNLHGIEIDPRAGSLAAFALTMKAAAKNKRFLKNPVQPRISVLDNVRFNQDDLDYMWSLSNGVSAERSEFDAFWNAFEHADSFGSLIQPNADLVPRLKPLVDGLEAAGNFLGGMARRVIEQSEVLAQAYTAVVANPPYMGSNNMGDALVRFAEAAYPSTKSDFYTMFMARAELLTCPGGGWGLISPHGWMFQSSFSAWRRHFLTSNRLSSLLQLGRGVFGSDWASAAFVAVRARPTKDSGATYRKLFERALDVRSRELLERLFLDTNYQSYSVQQNSFLEIDGTPLAFSLGQAVLDLLSNAESVSTYASPKQGLITGDNDRFLRYWWEVAAERITPDAGRGLDVGRNAPWVPYLKGGPPRRWAGNELHVVQWANDGYDIRNFFGPNGRQRSRPQNTDSYFRPGLTWSTIAGEFAVRAAEAGAIFDAKGSLLLLENEQNQLRLLGYLNSSFAGRIIATLSPTLDFSQGPVGRIPVPEGVLGEDGVDDAIRECVSISQADWAGQEIARDFAPRLACGPSSTRLSQELTTITARLRETVARTELLEREIDAHFWRLAGQRSSVHSPKRATLVATDLSEMPADKSRAAVIVDLVSYAVGCMFGRYSLDKSGLILADPGNTWHEYLAEVQAPSFMPDQDNVLPIVDDGWFEDDIVERFQEFLRAAFGVEHFAENLRFVEDSLGVKKLRDYFITKSGKSRFYDDHVQRYKKRPIYWMFSSPKGSFNALIYLHRYTPSTVSTLLNEYLREYGAKLTVALQQADAAAGGVSAKDQKEADRLRKVLTELRDYEHDVLYPLATQQLAIDLDDGVKVNYPKFYPAVKKIAGLVASDG